MLNAQCEMKMPVYLDYNATTPLHPEVVEEMRPFLEGLFGNPSSMYSYGAEARTEVEKARGRVASLLGCKSHEVFFTSGGTESNNMAIKGIAYAYASRGRHIITSRIEHPAVAEVCTFLEKQGFRVTRLEVDQYGLIDLDQLWNAITTETILVTVMHANNEIGTIQPVQEIAEICHAGGILFHTDAAQTAGKIPVDGTGADLISLAGHKLYGPKGVGALYIREGVKLEKMMHGADHEQNLRAGTENVMSVAGFGKACEVAMRDLERNLEVMQGCRNLLWRLLSEKLNKFWLNVQSTAEETNDKGDNSLFRLNVQSTAKNNDNEPNTLIRLNGHPTMRLPNTLNLSFNNVEAGLLLPAIAADVAASAGAACHAAEATLSPTLQAIAIPPEFAAGTVRFSTGRFSTPEEMEFAAEVIVRAVLQLKGMSSFGSWQSAVGSPQSSTVNRQSSIISTSKFPKGDLNTEEEAPFRRLGVKLTAFTAGLGCACKLKPQLLQKVMADLPFNPSPDVLVGPDTFDDAAVYKINDEVAIVQTVDFFTPVLDDPYDFGRVAAANSLSDIYAMGASPHFALNIAGFPSTRLPMEVFQQILKGASDVAEEAGISILGGHTVDDLEPKFGMAVTGLIHPDRILRNSTAKAGDVLLLTKPIGTGILATALKRGLLDEETTQILTETMATLNRKAAEIMLRFPVSACTDVTGFGLLGHLHEMTSGSMVNAELHAKAVPLLARVEEFAAAGIMPGGSIANLDFVSEKVNWGDGISFIRKSILSDAQTSGGLLISVPESVVDEMASLMRAEGIAVAAIGKVIGKGTGQITVT
jgi:selenium donor protein